MKKKFTLGSMAVLSAIFIAGCGGINDDSTPEACQFEVSQALDKGNYDYVIQKLSSDPTCGGAYSEQEGKIQLAAAYIGKAGFDIPTLISDIIRAGAEDNNSNPNKDNYSLFVQALAKRVSGSTLEYLEKADNLYNEISKNYNCGDTSTLQVAPDIIKDACFYSGLVSTAKATSSISLLIAGDEIDPEKFSDIVEKWVSGESAALTCEEDANQNNIPDTVDASACALQYSASLSDGDSTNDSIPYNCDNTGSIQINSKEDNITFTKNSKNYTFTLINININSSGDCNNTNMYKRLIYNIALGTSNAIYTTAVTNGYCYTDFTNFGCNPKTDESCYPCPVITESKPASTVDSVIETINEGSEKILAIIPNDLNKNTVKEDIIEFKKDLCSYKPEACQCDTDGDGNPDTDCSADNISNARDVVIKSPENPEVQQLISEYLQK